MFSLKKRGKRVAHRIKKQERTDIGQEIEKLHRAGQN